LKAVRQDGIESCRIHFVLRHVPVKHEFIFIGDGIMKRLNLLLALIAMLSLTACNTVQGVGKDIQAGGKAVEKVAK
jgi:entericidin B